MSDLSLPAQLANFNTLLSETTERDRRAERIISEQVSKLMLLSPFSSFPTSASRLAATSPSSAADAQRQERLQKMIDPRRRQVQRWSAITEEALVLAPRLDLAGDRLKARDVRQTMYVYMDKLEDAQEDLETRTRLLKRSQGLQIGVQSRSKE
ncbi:hypothetical protein SUNI508_12750 [Seiridium unicorne]|uniref:BHLH domain-containing protein n=1 Tax=Seiridium unicorne TaxID=138068 RepID=A0ABR2VGH6_9PEZI